MEIIISYLKELRKLSIDDKIKLNELTFGFKFNQPLTNLPINLTNLTICNNEYEYELPYQIKYLKLFGNIKLIDNLPDSIKELELINNVGKIELINLPCSIKKLVLYCKNVNLIILPKSIEYLKINKNISLDKIKNIPKNLIIEYFD